jgi:hypothetical protein
VLEAVSVDGNLIATRHLNGEVGPTVPVSGARALERTYEKELSA